jgi:predicted permease
VRHFLSEGLVLAVLGIVIGLFVAQLGVGVLRQIAETTLPPGTSFALEPRVLAFAIMIAAIGALAASVAPALAGTRVAAPTLRHDVARMSTTRAGRQLRLALVAGQLALAMVLLVGTGLFLRSLQRLDALELGYSTANALTFRAQFPQGPKYATDAYEDAFWSSLHEQLSALPGVVSVGFGNTPVSGSFGSSVESEDPSIATDRLPPVRWTAVSDDYFTTLGIRVRKGRTFAPSDKTGSPPVVVISRELAEKLAPGGDPIGSRIRLGPNHPLGWATVVGIVSDVRLRSTNATQPSVYTTQRQDHWHGGSRVVLRTLGDPRRLAEPVRAVMRRVEPAVPVAEMETLEKVQRTTPAIAERRIVMQLLLAFAVIGLVVSAIGVYGVGAYAMESRRREFGIRVALGATQRRVLWLALRDGIVVALLGILAGIPVAWLAGFRVRGLLYEVEPMEPATLGAVVILLTLVALIASVVPAKRASRVDPAATMRTD